MKWCLSDCGNGASRESHRQWLQLTEPHPLTGLIKEPYSVKILHYDLGGLNGMFFLPARVYAIICCPNR